METKPKTNADRIRNMTDEELAIFFSDIDCCNPRPLRAWNVLREVLARMAQIPGGGKP